jgi:hypothetical protein
MASVSKDARSTFIENSIHDFLVKIIQGLLSFCVPFLFAGGLLTFCFSSREICFLEFEGKTENEATIEFSLLAFFSILDLHEETLFFLTSKESMLCAHSLLADDKAVTSLTLSKHYKQFVESCYSANSMKILSKVIVRHCSSSSLLASYGSQVLCSLSLGCLLLDHSSDLLVLSSDRILSVLRVGFVAPASASSFSSPRVSALSLMGESGAISVFCSILTSYLTDDSKMVEWCLYGLLQLTIVEKSMEILKTTNICQLLGKILENYYIQPNNTDMIILFAFQLIVQLCVFSDCRSLLANIFSNSELLSTHLVLTSLAHHLTSTDCLRSGSEAISALCLSPFDDALSAISRQEQAERRRRKSSIGGTPTGRGRQSSFTTAVSSLIMGGSNEETETGAEKDAGRIDWLKFHGDKSTGVEEHSTSSTQLSSQETSLSGEKVSESSSTAGGVGFLSNFTSSFFKSSSKKTSDTDNTTASSSSTLSSDDPSQLQRRKKSFTSLSAIDSYNNLSAYNQPSSNSSMLYEAANQFISTGLSDQDEKMIASRYKNVVRKTSSELLVEGGAVALLVSAIQAHSTHEGILLSTLNALNSLAVSPVSREKFNDPLIYEVLTTMLKRSLQEEETREAMESNGEITPRNEGGETSPSRRNTGNSRRFSSKTLSIQLEAKRGVKILLLIVIGTICMPVIDEEAHVTTKQTKKNTGNTGVLFANSRKVHETNQQIFGELDVFSLFLTILEDYHEDTLVVESLLRSIYFTINGHSGNQEKFAKLISKQVQVQQPQQSEENKEKEKSEIKEAKKISGKGQEHDETEKENPTVLSLSPPAVVNGQKNPVGLVLVIDILKTNLDRPRIVYYGCLALASICGNHRENSLIIGNLGICELIVKLLNLYLEKQEIITACCQVVFSCKALNDHHWEKSGIFSCLRSLFVCLFACLLSLVSHFLSLAFHLLF